MANPEKSGSAYAQAYGIYKLYGWDGIKKLIANAKILDSSSLIYKGVAAGEYPLGITMEYAAHRYIVGGDKNVGIIYPADGAFIAPEATGIVKNCPHPAEAKKFVDYLISKKVEDEIFAKFSRRPARPDAADTEGLPALKKITLLKSFDPMEANTLEKEILGKWKEIVLSRNKPMRVELTRITKLFGSLRAVDDVSLTIGEGDFFTLLGPSGCGKTTLLRTIAGFLHPDAGEIRFGERVINHIPPHRRETGMVFQNYALFPHLSVSTTSPTV